VQRVNNFTDYLEHFLDTKHRDIRPVINNEYRLYYQSWMLSWQQFSRKKKKNKKIENI